MEDLHALPGLLLPWYGENRRDLPWRRDREPYHVWVSEIMLQQTRVEAVRGYYARFLEALPTVADLARCEDDRLHKLWEGLGYYSRVRNLKKAAQVIEADHGGVFPRDYASIRALPGVGDYTAGAVASICFGLPEPAVDGNVLRVLARLRADPSPVTAPGTKRAVQAALRDIYPAGRCGDFTQALMELGATVCLPNGAPRCEDCPLRAACAGRDRWRELPVKEKKKPRRTEEKTVLLLRCGEKWAVRRRGDTGLLAGLWEFPNVPGRLSAQEALALAERCGCRPLALEREARRTHIFTHITWDMTGYYLRCAAAGGDFHWAAPEELDRALSLPTAFRQFRDGAPGAEDAPAG